MPLTGWFTAHFNLRAALPAHVSTVWSIVITTRQCVYAAYSWCVWTRLGKTCYDMLKMNWMFVKSAGDRGHTYTASAQAPE